MKRNKKKGSEMKRDENSLKSSTHITHILTICMNMNENGKPHYMLQEHLLLYIIIFNFIFVHFSCLLFCTYKKTYSNKFTDKQFFFIFLLSFNFIANVRFVCMYADVLTKKPKVIYLSFESKKQKNNVNVM